MTRVRFRPAGRSSVFPAMLSAADIALSRLTCINSVVPAEGSDELSGLLRLEQVDGDRQVNVDLEQFLQEGPVLARDLFLQPHADRLPGTGFK